MKFIVKTKAKSPQFRPSAHTSALMAATPKRGENNSLEWDVKKTAVLTPQEIQALNRYYAPHSPNLQRATEVKNLMLQKKKRVEIVSILTRSHRGQRGYGERVISGDHATLSKVGEGVKK